MHTKRGGQIQTKQLAPEIDDIINLKKPRKLKIVKMLLTILKHFLSSMYFGVIVIVLYIFKFWYTKYYSAYFVQTGDIKKLKTKFI